MLHCAFCSRDLIGFLPPAKLSNFLIGFRASLGLTNSLGPILSVNLHLGGGGGSLGRIVPNARTAQAAVPRGFCTRVQTIPTNYSTFFGFQITGGPCAGSGYRSNRSCHEPIPMPSGGSSASARSTSCCKDLESRASSGEDLAVMWCWGCVGHVLGRVWGRF